MSACILCIEDEATLLADLLEELKAADYQVVAASSVEQKSIFSCTRKAWC